MKYIMSISVFVWFGQDILQRCKYCVFHLWDFCWSSLLGSEVLHIKVPIQGQGITCLFYYWNWFLEKWKTVCKI